MIWWISLCMIWSTISIIVWEVANHRLYLDETILNMKIWIVLLMLIILFLANMTIITYKIIRRKDVQIIKR